MNLVDTSGWIEFFFEEPNASYFSKPIEETSCLIVSVVCLYEIFKKINLIAGESKALQAIAQMKQGLVIEITEEIAIQAANISLKHKLPMADSFIYTTGIVNGAIIWTQDAHFKNLPNVNFKEKHSI